MARTVLIVDDDAGFRTRARASLTLAGFEVVGEAADGRAGLQAARQLGPEIVLLDVQLPDVSGLEVARVLSGDPRPPAVVLISSREASDYGTGIERSGARGFISKAELSAEALTAILGGAAP